MINCDCDHPLREALSSHRVEQKEPIMPMSSIIVVLHLNCRIIMAGRLIYRTTSSLHNLMGIHTQLSPPNVRPGIYSLASQPAMHPSLAIIRT